MSLGGGASAAIDQAVRTSIASGLTYAVAAGNGNAQGVHQDACTVSPSRVAEAITVGAVDKTDTKASFSNYGTCVDLFAPGVFIISSTFASDTSTGAMSGTSMATPHVAGAAALHLATNPTATPAQVQAAVTANATTNHVANAMTGSPNRLLYTGFAAAAPTVFSTATDLPIPGTGTAQSPITVAAVNGTDNLAATYTVNEPQPGPGN